MHKKERKSLLRLTIGKEGEKGRKDENRCDRHHTLITLCPIFD